jgi:ubiquinone/menaquinone biosynthesis C-methylase UbiE
MHEENQKIKQGVKDTFDEVAESYDTNKQFAISAQKMAKLIEKLEVKEMQHILDLSTGTGSIAIELAKKYPNATVHAVDISDEMLNIARAKAKEEGLSNISFHQQDVEDLDNVEFQSLKFDLITCGYGLFFYPNMDGVFCDICSRLKNGGHFVFSTFRDNAFEPYSSIFLEHLKKDYGIEPPQKIEKVLLKNEEEIHTLTQQIEHNGLTINYVDIRFLMDIQEWWSLLNTTGYQGLLTQLEENYAQFEKEYLEHLRTLHTDGNIEFNADSFISVVKV